MLGCAIGSSLAQAAVHEVACLAYRPVRRALARLARPCPLSTPTTASTEAPPPKEDAGVHSRVSLTTGDDLIIELLVDELDR
jgi:hypothetical protein